MEYHPMQKFTSPSLSMVNAGMTQFSVHMPQKVPLEYQIQASLKLEIESMVTRSRDITEAN
jgi:hypothetical protein